MPTTHARILVAELVGTGILMLGGPGSAILAGNELGPHGIALAFGLSLLVAAYVVGPVSGCHINPAVTVGMVLMKKTPVNQLVAYLVGQFVGAALGGGIIFVDRPGPAGLRRQPVGLRHQRLGRPLADRLELRRHDGRRAGVHRRCSCS